MCRTGRGRIGTRALSCPNQIDEVELGFEALRRVGHVGHQHEAVDRALEPGHVGLVLVDGLHHLLAVEARVAEGAEHEQKELLDVDGVAGAAEHDIGLGVAGQFAQ